MEKLYLTGFFPGIIDIIASFLDPASCLLKKNTDGTHLASLSKKFNAIFNVTRKPIKCSTSHLLTKEFCEYHCRAFPIYKMLDERITEDNEKDFIHFDTKAQANFMKNHNGNLIAGFCCGTGFQWRKSIIDRWAIFNKI